MSLHAHLQLGLQIHSVLIDHINPATAGSDCMTEFSGPTLHGAFKAYMGILVNLRVAALGTYHTLMHQICMTARCAHRESMHALVPVLTHKRTAAGTL